MESKAIKVISITFAVTAVAGCIAIALCIIFLGDRLELAAFFGPFYLTIAAFLIESILFAIIYRKQRGLALGLSVLPIGVIVVVAYSKVSDYLEDQRIDASPTGTLPVSQQQYQADTSLIAATVWADSNYRKHLIQWYSDTVTSVSIDTVYYSHNRHCLLSTVILHTKNNSVHSRPDYQAGIRSGAGWKLKRVEADMAFTNYSSDSALKYDVKHYLYKRFSINGSSSRPEIWDDTFIFARDSLK